MVSCRPANADKHPGLVDRTSVRRPKEAVEAERAAKAAEKEQAAAAREKNIRNLAQIEAGARKKRTQMNVEACHPKDQLIVPRATRAQKSVVLESIQGKFFVTLSESLMSSYEHQTRLENWQHCNGTRRWQRCNGACR